MLRSALVALDGSAYSEGAADLAIGWAGRYGVPLLGLGILDAPTIAAPDVASVSPETSLHEAAGLLLALHEEADRLNRLVQNLLDVPPTLGEPPALSRPDVT
jgi:nucleotide-binding universal stress UspA family protein